MKKLLRGISFVLIFYMFFNSSIYVFAEDSSDNESSQEEGSEESPIVNDPNDTNEPTEPEEPNEPTEPTEPNGRDKKEEQNKPSNPVNKDKPSKKNPEPNTSTKPDKTIKPTKNNKPSSSNQKKNNTGTSNEKSNSIPSTTTNNIENDTSTDQDDTENSESETLSEEDITMELIKESGSSIKIKDGKIFVEIDGNSYKLSNEKVKELGLENLLKKHEKQEVELPVEVIEQEEEVANTTLEQEKNPKKKPEKRNFTVPIGIISISILGAVIFGYRFFK